MTGQEKSDLLIQMTA